MALAFLVLLGPGSRVDIHPSGEISSFFIFATPEFFLFRDRVSTRGSWVLGDCAGGTKCLGSGCLGHAVKDETSGDHQKKIQIKKKRIIETLKASNYEYENNKKNTC